MWPALDCQVRLSLLSAPHFGPGPFFGISSGAGASDVFLSTA